MLSKQLKIKESFKKRKIKDGLPQDGWSHLSKTWQHRRLGNSPTVGLLR